MKAISKETKRNAVRDYNTQGMTLRQVAERYGISPETIRNFRGYKAKSKGPKGKRLTNPAKQTSLFETDKVVKPLNSINFPNTNRRWSKTEDSLLVDAVLDKLTVAETSNVLGRTLHSVINRKHLLTSRGLIQEETRFPVPEGVKRPRRSENVVKSDEEVVNTPSRIIGINQIELSDLAVMVKSYGVSVTVMVTEKGTEVKLHN